MEEAKKSRDLTINVKLQEDKESSSFEVLIPHEVTFEDIKRCMWACYDYIVRVEFQDRLQKEAAEKKAAEEKKVEEKA